VDTQEQPEPASKPDWQPLTFFDLKRQPAGIRDLLRLPELVLEGLALVWRASKRRFTAILLLQVVAAATLAAQLLLGRWVLRRLMDVDPSGYADADSLLVGLAALIGATLITGVVALFGAHHTRHLSELVAVRTFEKIIDVATSVQLSSFEDPLFYDKLTRASTSGLSKPMEMVNGITTLAMGLLTSLGIGFALFSMHPLLLVLVIVASIPILVSTLSNSRKAYDFEFNWTPESRERWYLFQLLTGQAPAKEVRLFNATPLLRSRFDSLTQERLSRLRVFLRRRLRVAMLGTVGGAIGGAIALGALVWLVVRGSIDIATAVTAGAAMQMLTSRASGMIKSVGSLIESGMFLNDYRTFTELGYETETGPQDSVSSGAAVDQGAVAPLTFQGLEVSSVTFKYPMTDSYVLNDVSLEVGPGEIVALVGENGSGKTTLVKLICQLYSLQTGKIYWNGVETDKLDPKALRSEITVIFQDFIHYHLTARDNISLGRVDALHDAGRVVEAARQAGAHPFLSRLPQGYETRLGRQFYGGHELSVGQWQRLALARAFFRGGSFLILDEPTAALDPRAEHELFSQMRALSKGRSALLVSHRFSSVRTADRIYVLHQGRVIESGTHAQLMALDGHYAELFRLQAAAYLGDEPDPNTPISSRDAGSSAVVT
jgi:ATP-binding cassette subfamily B protein